jgi:ABC-type amino acid transport substrate-binding protein
MKPATTLFSAALIAILSSYTVVKITAPQNSVTVAEKKESVTERIERTGVIRCGYVAYAPYLIKDANSGKLSGIFYDITEKMGKLLNLKIEWTQETSFATYIQDMKSGRYDVYCAGLWPEAARAREITFTRPVNYVALGVYVRADDTRFDSDVTLLNTNDHMFSTMDGEMSDFVVKEDFPQAHVLSHSHNVDVTQLIMDVVTKKSDAVIIEKAVAEEFLKKNPGTLKNVTAERPIRFFGNTWATPVGNPDLVARMNTTLEEMVNTGFVDKVIKKYDPEGINFYPMALPFAHQAK